VGRCKTESLKQGILKLPSIDCGPVGRSQSMMQIHSYVTSRRGTVLYILVLRTFLPLIVVWWSCGRITKSDINIFSIISKCGTVLGIVGLWADVQLTACNNSFF
jgi:hypothetical protein